MAETKMTLLHQLDTILQQHNVSSGYKEGLNDPNYTLQHKQFHQVSIFIVVIHTLHVANSYTIPAHIMLKGFVQYNMQQSWDLLQTDGYYYSFCHLSPITRL